MKPESRQPTNIAKRIFAATAVLLGLLSLSGCITSKVLEMRQARETRVKAATNFWSLAAVRSAHVVSGGDAFACVEFRDSPGDAPQTYTINLSQTSRLGRAYADFMPGGSIRAESGHGSGTSADPGWRLYPLQEAQKGCSQTIGESLFQVSDLRVDTLIEATPDTAIDKELEDVSPGTVTFTVTVPKKDGSGLEEEGERFELSQGDFVEFLKTGKIRLEG